MKGVDRLVGDARERHPRPMDARERTVVWCLSIAYLAAASAVAFAVPWNRHPSVLTLVGLVALFGRSERARTRPCDDADAPAVSGGRLVVAAGTGAVACSMITLGGLSTGGTALLGLPLVPLALLVLSAGLAGLAGSAGLSRT
jgi:hypothetical protein